MKRAPEHGVALILVLLVMMTVSALALSLAVLVSTESRVTMNYRDGLEVLYGADAALERVLPLLAEEPQVDRLLAGLAQSILVDGPPGLRTLPDGTAVDLRRLTAEVSCGKATCNDADLDAAVGDRPWGSNNPRWQLYAHGRLADWLPGGAEGSPYVVVWIADDPSETDGLPLVDGGDAAGDNPGRGRLSLLAHAYGRSGARRIVAATVARDDIGLRVLSWRSDNQ